MPTKQPASSALPISDDEMEKAETRGFSPKKLGSSVGEDDAEKVSLSVLKAVLEMAASIVSSQQKTMADALQALENRQHVKLQPVRADVGQQKKTSRR